MIKRFMKFISGVEHSSKINWKYLTSENQLDDLIEQSRTVPVAIYKHSTRCGVSSMAKSKLEREWDIADERIEMYFLDLIPYRSVSNAVAKRFKIVHQSPQLIVIKNGKSVYNQSHMDISVSGLKKILNVNQDV